MRHFIAWAIFITYESGTIYIVTGTYGHIGLYILFYTLNIGLFYFTANRLLPLAFQHTKPYVKAFLLIVLELSIYLLVKFGLDYLLHKLPALQHQTFDYSKYLIINLWRGLFFIGISTLYWSVLRMINYQREATEAESRYYYALAEKVDVERALAETQNAYLQQQINPHFLFNVLDFIYNSFYHFSASAAFCVSKLADILRYSLDEVGPDGKVKLSSEVDQIKNLIEINRLRYKFPLYIDLEVKGNIQDQRILPLILLSFTENMFKHGNLKEQQYPAHLSIELIGQDQLIFISTNLKKSRKPVQRQQHIGLTNAVKRLKYTYMEDYQLSIKDEEDLFGIELHINL